MTILRALLLFLVFAGAALAQLPGGRHMEVSLVAETQRPEPGSTVTLALAMDPEPGWHGYWRNPGDAGAPTRVEWRLPDGIEAGALRYPVPDRLTVAGLVNYVFKGPYAHLLELKVPDGLALGTRLPIRGSVDYLVCTDELCVPEQAEVAADLVVGDGAIGPAARERFDGWRAAMPRPLGSEGRFAVAGDRLRIVLPLPAAVAAEEPYLFPVTEDAAGHSAVQSISRRGNALIVETAAGSGAAGLDRFEGVLEIAPDQGLAFTAMPGEVPPAGDPIGGAASDAGTVLLALLGAIVGGLILNVMPCVFPILSLKALSLARLSGNEAAARKEAGAYAAGVILTCLALGGALLAVRASGAAVGWAFQLQDPRVILVLLLLVTAIALNLAGLFRLPAFAGGESLARSGGTRGAFWTGALAAFVATPCTGPFMGAALGAALILPTAAALAVFAGLGFGLALPFLLLGFVPALRRRLPQPGPWMERLQRVLSVPMFVTALGLAWILGRQSGADGMALGLAAALALGLCLWWAGRRQSGAWLPLLPAFAAAAAALAVVPMEAPAGATAGGVLGAEPFSEARLDALRGEDRPVFVYFTADWCLTCKVNERSVLDREAVANAFSAGNVAVLEGDWTRGDAEIGRFLSRHGRSGVPLYLYYPRGGGAPRILPQILTVGSLVGLP